MAPEKVRKDHGVGGSAHAREFEETATVHHRPGKGATHEEIVREFIAKYLPRQADVTGRGEIITAGEQVSAECDVMIVNKSTPPFMDYGVFEVNRGRVAT